MSETQRLRVRVRSRSSNGGVIAITLCIVAVLPLYGAAAIWSLRALIL